ncbi:hypothetical protein EV356DRAFT_518191 [Viridothelium virens]|uniref:Fungal N-terminal domain-containing protein n=1 Tax=Viridothelium virens TaxID=1048519 RepID=A0A6A6H155_VIRVR|nr:hypothetical protein EV356DRAFT_518191 [Viridothelium virens]
MNPLSISASIVGILAAAGQISFAVTDFLRKTHGAPKTARRVLEDVNGLSVVLTELQNYLLNLGSASKPSASLILVEQIVVTLSDCVAAFSELEELLGTSESTAEIRLLKVYQHFKSIDETRVAVDRLSCLVESILNSNLSLRTRIRDSEAPSDHFTVTSISETDAKQHITYQKETDGDIACLADENLPVIGFEAELSESRVYAKSMRKDSAETLLTSAHRVTPSSMFSAVSLSDVSNLSLVAVPIYAQDISNAHRYVWSNLQRHESLSREALLNSMDDLVPFREQRNATLKWPHMVRFQSIDSNITSGGAISLSLNDTSLLDSKKDYYGLALEEAGIIFHGFPGIDQEFLRYLKNKKSDWYFNSSSRKIQESMLALELLLGYLPTPIISGTLHRQFVLAMQRRRSGNLDFLQHSYTQLFNDLHARIGRWLSFSLELASNIVENTKPPMATLRLASALQPLLLSHFQPCEDDGKEDIDQRLSEIQIISWLIDNAARVVTQALKSSLFTSDPKVLICGYGSSLQEPDPDPTARPSLLFYNR